MTEFEIINKYFEKLGQFEDHKFLSKKDFLGIGDDGAVLPLMQNEGIVVSTDMMVEGTHFLPDADAFSVGYKLLSVNLSDIAAMGADPICYTLSLSLNVYDHLWLSNFCNGLSELSVKHKCPLVGGDLTRGSKNSCKVFSVTILGVVSNEKILRRDSIKVDDDIWISGDLGEPSTALLLNKSSKKLDYPLPRLDVAGKIRNFANSAIDISDGLSSELAHLVFASSVKQNINYCIEIYFDSFDSCLSPLMKKWLKGTSSFFDLCKVACSSGDEYEICFSAPKEKRSTIRTLSKNINTPLTLIGKV